MSSNVTIFGGGTRFSRAEETALNLLLRRHGGDCEGMQTFKLGWAVEDNSKVTIPICFHENQMSYHLLVWEPPNPTTSILSTQLGEDTSKGTYSCLLHFVDDNNVPIPPTGFIIERVIDILRTAQEIALAARKGDIATLERLRAQKRAQIRAKETQRENAYDSYCESVLNDAKPAFEGNPMSGSTKSAGITLSDIASAPKPEQPTKFDFTLKSRKSPTS